MRGEGNRTSLRALWSPRNQTLQVLRLQGKNDTALDCSTSMPGGSYIPGMGRGTSSHSELAFTMCHGREILVSVPARTDVLVRTTGDESPVANDGMACFPLGRRARAGERRWGVHGERSTIPGRHLAKRHVTSRGGTGASPSAANISGTSSAVEMVDVDNDGPWMCRHRVLEIASLFLGGRARVNFVGSTRPTPIAASTRRHFDGDCRPETASPDGRCGLGL